MVSRDWSFALLVGSQCLLVSYLITFYDSSFKRHEPFSPFSFVSAATLKKDLIPVALNTVLGIKYILYRESRLAMWYNYTTCRAGRQPN